MSRLKPKVQFTPYGHPYIEVDDYEIVLDVFHDLLILNKSNSHVTSVDYLKSINYNEPEDDKNRINNESLKNIKNHIDNGIKEYLIAFENDEDDEE